MSGGETLAAGEVEGRATAMVGGSLPPRKRLLAGLKQNASWQAASGCQASPITPEIIHGPDEGASSEELDIVDVSPNSTAISTEANGSCVSCGALESSSWMRVKRNGAVHRMCSSCASLLNKNTSCLRCQAICPNVKDPSVWTQCRKCVRVVHVGCEKRSADSDSSICLVCRQVKVQNESGTALLGAGASGYVGILGGKCCRVGSGNCASSTATESLRPRNKKTRVLKETCDELSWKVAGDADDVERMPRNSKAAVERSRQTSQQIAVAAAEEVAALASMAAAKAKATAAVKAAAAIKAAAAAKTALDAAALAAHADAQIRAQLCRSSLFSEQATAANPHYEGAQVQTRKGMVEKHDVKVKVEIHGATRSSIGDEELARQLHRVINSSPRTSRGLAPLRRKSAGQPGPVSTEISRSPSDEFVLNNRRNSLELEDSPSPSMSYSAGVHWKPWQRGNSKGVAGGGQGFASGVHTSSLSSQSPIPIRTPSLTSRSTTSHS